MTKDLNNGICNIEYINIKIINLAKGISILRGLALCLSYALKF